MQRHRTNAKGQSISSNFGVTRESESTYSCNGCGRKFSAHSASYRGYVAWSTDAPRLYALTYARAQRHADRCKGELS